MPTGDFDKAPNPKIQAPKKSQSPNSKNRQCQVTLGAWSLEVLWDLELGIWSLRRGRASPSVILLPMDAPLVDLRNALRERRAIIADEQSRRDPTAHLARLKEVSEQIERLEAALPRPLDPQLAHYLTRKSYDKALEFLEGRAPSRP
jgi:hypothetical protein